MAAILRVQRALDLRKKRGLNWLLRSVLAEIPLLPRFILAAARGVYSLDLTSKFMPIAGVHTDQLWAERREALQRVAGFLKEPADVLEIGSWFGAGSTQIWLAALKPGSSLTIIDSWKSYFAAKDRPTSGASAIHMDAVPQHAISSTLRRVFQHEATNSGLRINVIRADSAAFLPILKDALFDLIYVDGSHYYEDVKRDLQQALRLIRPGGIIAGDDLDLVPTPELLDLAHKNIEKNFVLLDGGLGFHPGVMLAVHEILGSVQSDQGTWWKFVTTSDSVLDDSDHRSEASGMALTPHSRAR